MEHLQERDPESEMEDFLSDKEEIKRAMLSPPQWEVHFSDDDDNDADKIYLYLGEQKNRSILGCSGSTSLGILNLCWRQKQQEPF